MRTSLALSSTLVIRRWLASCVIVLVMAGAGCGATEATDEIWDLANEPLEPFVITTEIDYGNWNGLPVPKGTTHDDYYGTGPSILHGPGRAWRIETPYSFRFVRQEGARLYLEFTHHERIAHAFIGQGLYGNRFEPRNPGMAAFYRFKWRPVSGGGCYTGLQTFLLEPHQTYSVVLWLPLVSAKRNQTLRIKVDMDTGCWLNFQSAPFKVRIPYEGPAVREAEPSTDNDAESTATAEHVMREKSM